MIEPLSPIPSTADQQMNFPPAQRGEIVTGIIFGDITDPLVVGSETAIVIPGNTYYLVDTSYPRGIQAALLKKTSQQLMDTVREAARQVSLAGSTLINEDMVLIDTDDVPGSAKWKANVPPKLIFAVTMEPDDRKGHRVTRESLATCVERILDRSNALGLTAIAFPTIGTGLMGLSLEDFFGGFTEGLNRFRTRTTNPNLTDIKVVVFPNDVSKLPPNPANLLQTPLT